MASTSATLPGTGANDNAVGTVAWSNPTNIQADDTSYATAFGQGGQLTNYLKGTGFGFSIPSGATINGVELSIERFADQAGSLRYVRDNTVSMVKGGTVSGDNKADTATKWPTSQTAKGYGTSSDLWGNTLTDSDINASNFGFVLNTNHYGAAGATGSVDCFKVTVTYTESGSSGVPKQQSHYARLRRS